MKELRKMNGALFGRMMRSEGGGRGREENLQEDLITTLRPYKVVSCEIVFLLFTNILHTSL